MAVVHLRSGWAAQARPRSARAGRSTLPTLLSRVWSPMTSCPAGGAGVGGPPSSCRVIFRRWPGPSRKLVPPGGGRGEGVLLSRGVLGFGCCGLGSGVGIYR
eukprot:4275547-Alexandrium_andersonii.AAC.1